VNSDDVRRLMTDPVFQKACEALDAKYKQAMSVAVGEAELTLAYRKSRVLYDVLGSLAELYETALYDERT
jgi:hypothetical protein